MNPILKMISGLGAVCALILTSGCASSNLVDIWHDSSFQSQPLSKMLVIAVQGNAVRRRIWEDAFAGGLALHGVAATASYKLFPNAPPDTSQIGATVQANGFDATMVILTLPTETEKQYVNGYVITEQDMNNRLYYSDDYHDRGYGPYWRRYGSYYSEIVHPGYVDSQKVAVHSIDVNTTGDDGRMIWSATSRTPEPGSVANLQQGIAGLVITRLAHRNIIGPKKP